MNSRVLLLIYPQYIRNVDPNPQVAGDSRGGPISLVAFVPLKLPFFRGEN